MTHGKQLVQDCTIVKNYRRPQRKIEVDSIVGKGTTIRVFLPV